MKVEDAFNKLFHDNMGAIALLTIMVDYCEMSNVDTNLVYAIESIKDILESDRGAFDVLDVYVEKVFREPREAAVSE